MSKLLLFLSSLLSLVFRHPAPTPSPIPFKVTARLTVFASNLNNPRDLTFDPSGHLLVSLTAAGQVVRFDDTKPQILLTGLNKPHGLAYIGPDLYVAETDKVSVFKNGSLQKIVDLPSGGNHFTRSLLPYQGNLLVAIGSTCNVCVESNPVRGTIQLLDLSTKTLKPFATGLRNSVFMTIHPTTGKIYATEMGRDLLGDHLPPDELNIIESGQNYGWPFCYGGNQRDTDFSKDGGNVRDCPNSTAPEFYLPAHVAPLGLTFLPDGSLLVAEHGSWNSSVPVGYKLVRITPDGQITDYLSDLFNQFLGPSKGRPVDLLLTPDAKTLYISDDKQGNIYQLDL